MCLLITVPSIWSKIGLPHILSVRFTIFHRNHPRHVHTDHGSWMPATNWTNSHPHAQNGLPGAQCQILKPWTRKLLNYTSDGSTWSRGIASITGCSFSSHFHSCVQRNIILWLSVSHHTLALCRAYWHYYYAFPGSCYFILHVNIHYVNHCLISSSQWHFFWSCASPSHRAQTMGLAPVLTFRLVF